MADTIKVRSATVTDPATVVVWDQNENHPNGEVFISTDGAEHEVAKTPAIDAKIGNGELVPASRKDVKAVLEEGTEARPTKATGEPPADLVPSPPGPPANAATETDAEREKRLTAAADEAKKAADDAEKARANAPPPVRAAGQPVKPPEEKK